MIQILREALKEFDFLVTAEDGEGAGEARSSGDGTEWGKVIRNTGVGKHLGLKYVFY